MNKDCIGLEDIELYGFHGCFESERKIGGLFSISVKVYFPMPEACLNDELSYTVNYQSLYDITKHEMSIPANLIEHVAQRIWLSITQKHTNVDSAWIKLKKINPPLGGKTLSAFVEIFRSKE